MSEESELPKELPIVRDEKSGAILWRDLRPLTIQYMIPVGRLGKFLKGLVKGVLYGVRCSSCGAKYFPPRADCSRCGSSSMEWVEVSRRGRLLAYAVVNVKPESYQSYDDYVVGVAEMENGFRVLAWIKCSDLRELRRGMEIEVKVSKREKDNAASYEIIPVKKT